MPMMLLNWVIVRQSCASLQSHFSFSKLQHSGTYIPTYLNTCMHTYKHTYILKHMHTYIHTYILKHMHTYIHTYLNTCIHTYIHKYNKYPINTYLHKYIHRYLHTHIHTYINIYIHIHTYMYFISFLTPRSDACNLFRAGLVLSCFLPCPGWRQPSGRWSGRRFNRRNDRETKS